MELDYPTPKAVVCTQNSMLCTPTRMINLLWNNCTLDVATIRYPVSLPATNFITTQKILENVPNLLWSLINPALETPRPAKTLGRRPHIRCRIKALNLYEILGTNFQFHYHIWLKIWPENYWHQMNNMNMTNINSTK